MLKLKRGTVASADPLTVRVDGAERRAWADERMVGEVREGDEVIVNTEALDLGLGSGGFDVVHVNLTRGLEGGGARDDRHVMKLNYTSLQHAVNPVEPAAAGEGDEPFAGVAHPIPVLVVFLHGHLAPAAWAFERAAPGMRLGYVQTPGGALPGSLSRDVRELRSRGLLCDHLTAAAAHGGEGEAISVPGALHAAADDRGWDAVIAGPGPGILGSATALGHGGMAALDTAHGALALGMPTLVAPRLSASDPRPRHRGLSHHAETVLSLLLAPVRVALPEPDQERWPGLSELEERLRGAGPGHEVTTLPVDLDGYAASGLPARTMGRDIGEDQLFFAAALAGGDALGGLARQDSPDE